MHEEKVSVTLVKNVSAVLLVFEALKNINF